MLMNNIKKSAQACFLSLFSLMILSLAGGCEGGKIEEINQKLADLDKTIEEVRDSQQVVSLEKGPGVSVNCSKHKQDEKFTARVIYEAGCPVAVEFPDGRNGCYPGPVEGDPQPPVCVCIGKNEKVVWKAYPDDFGGMEFTVHFSPFDKGSFESKDGEAESRKIEGFDKMPGNSLVAFKYSISAGPDCTVLDPPFIIKK
jgi:hypothetical protein